MPVRLSAVLDHSTVEDMLAQLLPLTIDLGDDAHRDRFIQIDPPRLLEFVAERGIRIETSAKLQWTVGPMTIPFTISSIRFLLAPIVDGGRLNLAITLEDGDFKNVPRLIDRGVISQLNGRLAARPDALGWYFEKTLALRVALPATMAPLARFEMDAGAMTVSVGDSALSISLPLPMRFARSGSSTTLSS